MKKAIVIMNVLLLVTALYGCNKKTVISNEETVFTMSTDTASGVFSPFYSTSGVDSTMAGMTQISMLGSTASGEVAYGEDEAVVTLDMSQTLYDESGNVSASGDEDGTTVYQFVIKDDIVFSDGEPLTINDVLFNMYLYLDPVYTGSSTMYSTDIVGLSAYRTQDPDMTDESMSQYENTFTEAANSYMDDIEAYVIDDESFDAEYETKIKATIDELRDMFYDELLADWDSYESDLESIMLQYNLTDVWQAFLLYEGLLSIQYNSTTGYPILDDDGVYQVDFTAFPNASYDKDYCIQTVFDYYMGESYTKDTIMSVFNYYACGSEIYANLVAEFKTAAFDEIKDSEDGLLVKNISGITVVKGSQFNGTTTYDDTYDVLQVVINGVDPKAIWNFGFTVAPMHYYSDDYYTTLAMDADVYSSDCSDFGVNMGDSTWYQDTVKSKNAVPVGAGAYKMSTSTGTTADTTTETFASKFYNNGVIHFERNELFVLGSPVIKYIDYKEVTTSNVMNAVTDGSIHFATPSATEDNISTINSMSDTLDYTMNETSGYGYIGINAKYVQEVDIRRAIMAAMDVDLITDYYPNGLAEIIYRPMSLVSWVYDYENGANGTWDPEPVYNYDDGIEKINEYVQSAGYKMNSAGKYYLTANGTTKYLTYTFTIAGTSTDHPAYNVMQNAANLLNANGWTVTVRTDSTALTKLSTGGLEVWAAAWSSTIDPDMYQVYHIDSTASSVLNWGYDYIKANQSQMSYEYNLILDLSDLIDDGRSVLDEATRSGYYQEALDLVMDLAVELPTYQRNDLYVYNSTIIDTSTLVPKSECTPYYGPLSELWTVSLKID